MITVTVSRAPADKDGGMIVDPLIKATHVAVERGTQEINKTCVPRDRISTSGRYRGYVAPGTMATTDDLQHRQWTSMVMESAIVIDIAGNKKTSTTSLITEKIHVE